MLNKIQVLVVDDATVVRGMLTKIINAESDMEVAGTAADGKVGVEKAMALRPDVIVLDIDMPVMGGMEALGILRKQLPTTPVIIFSTLSKAGATITLDALAAGAADYSTKPSNAGSSAAAADQVRAELLVKIRGLATGPATRLATRSPGRAPGQAAAPNLAAPAPAPTRATAQGPTPTPTPATAPGPAPTPVPAPATAPVATRPLLRQPVEALLIGSSTGGPAALEAVLPKLPGNLSIPILMVQHMPPTFTTVLAERLDKLCPFPVHEAAEGMKVEPGHCYLAPGGFHMRPKRTNGGVHLALDDGPKVKSCRPSVDVMFDAAAEVYGGRLMAVVLTGMGDDGLDAASRLATQNVDIVAQDEESSVVWGMPGAIAKAGLATRCLPLSEIPSAMLETAVRRASAQPRAARAVTS